MYEEGYISLHLFQQGIHSGQSAGTIWKLYDTHGDIVWSKTIGEVNTMTIYNLGYHEAGSYSLIWQSRTNNDTEGVSTSKTGSFLNQEEKWKEETQDYYRNILMQADYINSVYQTPYQGVWQLGEKDKFLLSNSDGILLVYDEENEGTPKFLSKLAAKKSGY